MNNIGNYLLNEIGETLLIINELNEIKGGYDDLCFKHISQFEDDYKDVSKTEVMLRAKLGDFNIFEKFYNEIDGALFSFSSSKVEMLIRNRIFEIIDDVLNNAEKIQDVLSWELLDLIEDVLSRSYLKVGDIVRLKDGLIDGQSYGALDYLHTMGKKFKGKRLIIKESDFSDNTYKVEGSIFWFSREMLDKVED